MNTKAFLRNSAAKLLFLAGATAPQRRAAGRFSIATFHRVLPDAERQAYPLPGLAVTPEELDAFLAYFTEHFDCGALAVQHERYLSGEAPARPLLALTFDDAQLDNYRNARPVLARHRVKATFFAPVVAVERQEFLWHDRLGFALLELLRQPDAGREQLMKVLNKVGLSESGPLSLVRNVVHEAKGLSLDARLRLIEELVEVSGVPQPPEFARLMTFGELAELAADGHEIGSHSMTHCLMTECDDRALAYEVAESRRTLQARLGLPVESFCYPNGNADERTALAVAEAGYRRAVTTAWGSNGQEADPFRLRRCDMVAGYAQGSGGKLDPALVAFRMSGFYPGLK
ncbi:MAG: polysaccharide deacetylase family protein [Nitrosomonadales bacterium]|nr:polysaccharide deacetylase family protein [Nitrosomonadales bacterium]